VRELRIGCHLRFCFFRCFRFWLEVRNILLVAESAVCWPGVSFDASRSGPALCFGPPLKDSVNFLLPHNRVLTATQVPKSASDIVKGIFNNIPPPTAQSPALEALQIVVDVGLLPLVHQFTVGTSKSGKSSGGMSFFRSGYFSSSQASTASCSSGSSLNFFPAEAAAALNVGVSLRGGSLRGRAPLLLPL
jgi:hypothetical protein